MRIRANIRMQSITNIPDFMTNDFWSPFACAIAPYQRVMVRVGLAALAPFVVSMGMTVAKEMNAGESPSDLHMLVMLSSLLAVFWCCLLGMIIKYWGPDGLIERAQTVGGKVSTGLVSFYMYCCFLFLFVLSVAMPIVLVQRMLGV